jgi:hypothetical protein
MLQLKNYYLINYLKGGQNKTHRQSNSPITLTYSQLSNFSHFTLFSTKKK